MKTDKKKIAWIGLGKMGLPMAGRLLAEGHVLNIYDIDDTRAATLVVKGAHAAASAATAAAASDYIFTMVTNDDALLDAVTGPDGVVRGASAGAVLIDMGTHSPDVSARIAKETEEKGLGFLRAPVSGTINYAVEGRLTVFTSGPKKVYKKCLPLLRAFGPKHYYVGTGDEARYLKLLHNAMLAVTAMMTAEALVFGQSGGLDWAQMIEVLKNSVVGSPVIEYKADALAGRTFDLTFTAAQMVKDLDLALSAAAHVHTPMPTAALVRQFMEAMVATGQGERDFFAVAELMEKLSRPTG
jgi:3-hydroxyisobutyrate dehydrogenase-like beta-hydroxyacid dehydrogenase